MSKKTEFVIFEKFPFQEKNFSNIDDETSSSCTEIDSDNEDEEYNNNYSFIVLKNNKKYLKQKNKTKSLEEEEYVSE
jgi:spore coat polysaccharide biosynthesis predicted glycosyltransferase SpsG